MAAVAAFRGGEKARCILDTCRDLYGLDALGHHCDWFLTQRYLAPARAKQIRQRRLALCAQLSHDGGASARLRIVRRRARDRRRYGADHGRGRGAPRQRRSWSRRSASRKTVCMRRLPGFGWPCSAIRPWRGHWSARRRRYTPLSEADARAAPTGIGDRRPPLAPEPPPLPARRRAVPCWCASGHCCAVAHRSVRGHPVLAARCTVARCGEIRNWRQTAHPHTHTRPQKTTRTEPPHWAAKPRPPPPTPAAAPSAEKPPDGQ